jgi:N-acetylglucosamine-6-phosphate deacetylase
MSRPVLFQNGVLLDPEAATPEPGGLLIEGDRILARVCGDGAAPKDALRIDLGGALLAPGLIDVHFHGSLLFVAPDQLEAALQEASASLLRHGVTGFLVTTVAWRRAELAARVTRLSQILTRSDWPGARPLGLHLEGPWIRPEAAGAQPRGGIRPYDPEEGADLLCRAGGLVRMVTLAPEVPGVEALLEELARRGTLAAVGHTLAGADDLRRAIARGARHVTHLFNAMGPLHQRVSGVAAGALSDDRLSCDLICDGVHVDPDWVRIAARVKGEGLLLISDRVDPPAGVHAPSFGAGVVTDDGKVLRLPDGRLAGSRLGLDQALLNLQQWGGLPLEQAVAACSLRPARLLGMEGERGTLRATAFGDVLDFLRCEPRQAPPAHPLSETTQQIKNVPAS